MGEENLKEEPKKSKRKAEPPPLVWVAIVGMNYGPDNARIEAGEEVPASVLKASPWLIENSHVRPKKEATIG